MDNNNFYKLAEAAKIFDVSTAAVRYWINQGKLKAILTPGGHRRIKKSDFKVFEKKYLKSV